MYIRPVVEEQAVRRGKTLRSVRTGPLLGLGLREPLLQFTVLGLAVYGLHWGLTPAREERYRIVVDEQRRAELAASFAQQQGREPSESELTGYVEKWVEDEMLFREGLTIVEDDPGIRFALISRMRQRVRPQEVPNEPSEAVLHAYHQSHRALFRRYETVRFTEYQLPSTPDAEQRGRTLIQTLQAGGRVDDLLPVEFPPRTQAELASVRGEPAAAQIMSSPTGTWRLLESTRGMSVIRVDERTPAREPSFAEVRSEVAEAYLAAEAKREVDRQMATIRARYEVRGAESAP